MLRQLILSLLTLLVLPALGDTPDGRYLYVASPGIRDYLEYGGHGVLVYDIDKGHKFVKRIPIGGLDTNGKPLNIKGICASAATGRAYITTPKQIMCLDLLTGKILWEKTPDKGCDRMSIAPDGKFLYVPSFESDRWNVIDAASGDTIKPIITKSGAHNTVIALDGTRAFMGGLKSPTLFIADTSTHDLTAQTVPFSDMIRPFTVNGRGTLVYVCVNELLGFEIGDLAAGKLLHRVEIKGFSKGEVKRHGCPSHGIGLTPDEKEVWVVDAFNQRVHVFDNTVMPPKQIQSIPVRDQPGWITFSIDGTLAYPSSGDVIDVKTRKIVATLSDETGRPVQSEKLLEIDFAGGKPVRAGDQFGIGRVR
ncbi:MAG: YncE family protein [Tepidisphaerales bacterium]